MQRVAGIEVPRHAQYMQSDVRGAYAADLMEYAPVIWVKSSFV